MDGGIDIKRKTVKIFTGTTVKKGAELLNRDFDKLSFWSDNLETLAHYYEGCAVEITVKLDPMNRQFFIRGSGELEVFNVPLSKYTYGFSKMGCPKGAIWYSFSDEYLRTHVLEVKEIFPDLSAFNE